MEHTASSGVLLAFHTEGLVKAAREADAVIELLPQVGDFVVHGDALFRCHGKTRVSPEVLRGCVALGAERTLEQDPAFALRIIVDIAARASLRPFTTPPPRCWLWTRCTDCCVWRVCAN